MKTSTIMTISDRWFCVMLIGEKENGEKFSYDFVEKKWVDDLMITPNKITTMERLRDSKIGRKIQNLNLIDLNVMNSQNVEGLKDAKVFNNRFMTLTVNTPVCLFEELRTTEGQKPRKFYTPKKGGGKQSHTFTRSYKPNKQKFYSTAKLVRNNNSDKENKEKNTNLL